MYYTDLVSKEIFNTAAFNINNVAIASPMCVFSFYVVRKRLLNVNLGTLMDLVAALNFQNKCCSCTCSTPEFIKLLINECCNVALLMVRYFFRLELEDGTGRRAVPVGVAVLTYQ